MFGWESGLVPSYPDIKLTSRTRAAPKVKFSSSHDQGFALAQPRKGGRYAGELFTIDGTCLD